MNAILANGFRHRRRRRNREGRTTVGTASFAARTGGKSFEKHASSAFEFGIRYECLIVQSVRASSVNGHRSGISAKQNEKYRYLKHPVCTHARVHTHTHTHTCIYVFVFASRTPLIRTNDARGPWRKLDSTLALPRAAGRLIQ